MKFLLRSNPSIHLIFTDALPWNQRNCFGYEREDILVKQFIYWKNTWYWLVSYCILHQICSYNNPNFVDFTCFFLLCIVLYFRKRWHETALLCGSICFRLLFAGHSVVTLPKVQGSVFSIPGSRHVVSQHVQSRWMDAVWMREPLGWSAHVFFLFLHTFFLIHVFNLHDPSCFIPH